LEEQGRFSALGVRDFRLFWSSQMISLSGTWMQQVAIGWLVYSMTSSPFSLGLTMAIMSTPIMIFTLIGGITADRYPKKSIIMLTQSLYIIPAFILGFLAESEYITMWHIYGLVFFIGMLNAFEIPARQSYIVELVGKGNLLNAIALNSAAFNGARIIGPMLAGIVIAGVGVKACFFINALSYGPVIFVLSRIEEKGTLPVTGNRSIVYELKEGFRYILGERAIFALFGVISIISLFGIPYSSFLPVIAEDILHTGAQGLGRLGSAAGAGAFVAAVIIAMKGKVRRRFLYTSLALVSASFSLFFITFSKTEIITLSLLFFTGWGMVSFLALSNNFIQQAVPDELRGRVMSVYILVFLGMSPFGNLMVGGIADLIGTMNALRIASMICAVIAIMYISFRYKRKKAEAAT